MARVRVAIGEHTTFIVLSDHGFLPVEKDVAPQIALEAEGLFGRNSNGAGALKLKKLGAIHAGGSFAIYWLEPPKEEEWQALTRAVEQVAATGAVSQVLDRKQLRELGADPDAAVILDAANGFSFSDRTEGPLVCDSVNDRGTHGHLPAREGLEASFVAVGPGIKPAKNLGRLLLTQIAPTLAAILRLPANSLASQAAAIDLD